MFQLLRGMAPAKKAQRVQTIDQSIRRLSPVKTSPVKITPAKTSPAKDVIEDPISLALRVAAILDHLSIPYYIGGSLASSILGEPRYSEDLDLAIAATSTQTQPLLNAFTPNFYLSETAVTDALNQRSSSFNLISLDSAEKIDIFVPGNDPFSQSKLARRIQHPVPNGQLWIASAEDMVLQKLLWRRRSQSEKQWRDVLGILKVQAQDLDFDYLENWATQLQLLDDLIKVLSEAGL